MSNKSRHLFPELKTAKTGSRYQRPASLCPVQESRWGDGGACLLQWLHTLVVSVAASVSRLCLTSVVSPEIYPHNTINRRRLNSFFTSAQICHSDTPIRHHAAEKAWVHKQTVYSKCMIACLKRQMKNDRRINYVILANEGSLANILVSE
jgi:hypothetical protein